MQRRRSILNAFASALLLCAVPAIGRAAYPDHAVRIVVPFAPGGGTDLVARTLAVGLTQELGQTVIVDNKPGAGTIVGTDAVAQAAPDGYTLLLATFAHAVNPSLQKQLPYDTAKAFEPIGLVGRSNNVLVVKEGSPLHTIQDVIAAAKANPEKLTYASQGIGTSAHLAGELFTNLAGVKLTHVPYRGAGPALTELMGGQVDMMMTAPNPYSDAVFMAASSAPATAALVPSAKRPLTCRKANAMTVRMPASRAPSTAQIAATEETWVTMG